MGTLKFYLRTSALLEGISFLLLLLVAMPLKYMAGEPAMVRYTGMAHGVFFVWYVFAVILAKEAYRFTLPQTALALLASLLPFGTFYADNKLFKKLGPATSSK